MASQTNDTEYQILKVKWSPRGSSIGSKRSRKPVTIESYLPGLIAKRDYVLNSELTASIVSAESACNALASLGELVGLDTVARQLLCAESVASSRIEGYVVSNRQLARAAVSGAHDQNALTVLGNVAAVTAAIELADKKITRKTFTTIHRQLFEGTSQSGIAGDIRTSQNWIGGNATTPVDAEFVPPPADHVGVLLDDLARFCNRTDLPAVLQAAIAHAQFETIHPFADGNGRVGRALVPTILRRRQTIADAIPPISLFLAAAAKQYIQGLINYRDSPADDWFIFFAETAERAARETRSLAASVSTLQEEWRQAAGRPRVDSAASKLINALPTHPVLTLATAIEVTGASDEACRNALNSLEVAGVLNETTAGKRNRVWESVGLFALLDEFESSNSGGSIDRPNTRRKPSK